MYLDLGVTRRLTRLEANAALTLEIAKLSHGISRGLMGNQNSFCRERGGKTIPTNYVSRERVSRHVRCLEFDTCYVCFLVDLSPFSDLLIY